MESAKVRYFCLPCVLIYKHIFSKTEGGLSPTILINVTKFSNLHFQVLYFKRNRLLFTLWHFFLFLLHLSFMYRTVFLNFWMESSLEIQQVVWLMQTSLIIRAFTYVEKEFFDLSSEILFCLISNRSLFKNIL